MPAPGEKAVEKSSNSNVVRHLVFFRYKDGTDPADIEMITKRFLALKHECKRPDKTSRYVVSIDAGKANSHEGADLGLTHGFLVTFNSEYDRDYYVGRITAGEEGTAKLKDGSGKDLYDPAHEKFKLDVGQFLYSPEKDKPGIGVMVFDFTTDKF